MKLFKSSIIRKIKAVIMMIFGLVFLAYFILWCTGIVKWSFNIGMLFILISSILLIFQSIRLMLNKRCLLLGRFRFLRIAIFLAVSVFLLMFSVVEGMIIYSSIHGDEKIKAEYIMIPGAEVVKDRPSKILLSRLETALLYIKENPDVTIIVSGAKGSGDVYSEAEVMKQYLVKYGVEEKRIFKDEKALNSYQNVSNTIEIISNISSIDNPKLMIVTNNYHTFRCKMIANSMGVDAYGINVPIHYRIVPVCYATEFFSVIKTILQLVFRF